MKKRKKQIYLCRDLKYNISGMINQTRNLLIKSRNRQLSQYGLSSAWAAILFVASAKRGKATPSDVSRWLGVEPHTISGLMGKMEKAGLLKKERDLPRKNRYRIVLTEKGNQAYQNTTNRIPIYRILSSLSKEQQGQLLSLLEIVRDKAVEELGD
jgi:DNA-binding MarR family transcriptional regulator